MIYPKKTLRDKQTVITVVRTVVKIRLQTTVVTIVIPSIMQISYPPKPQLSS